MNKRIDSLTPAERDARDRSIDDDPSHPVATGVGAVLGGAATGAAVASVAGPIGTVAGAAAGAVVGGLMGKGVAESVDPAHERAYWEENYRDRPYVDRAYAYDDYWPAFGYGMTAFSRYPGRRFDEFEPELARDWEKSRGASRLEWDNAKHATRDAWQRLSDGAERMMPGDSDRDGK